VTDIIRLGIMSDLHNEFEDGSGPVRRSKAWLDLDQTRRDIPGHPQIGPRLDTTLADGVDLMVTAGDIALDLDSIRYADQVSNFLRVPVICIPGNHEPYRGRDLMHLVPEMRAAAKAASGDVIFLENESYVFEKNGRKVHILGCSLWTDYEVNGRNEPDIAFAMLAASRSLNDHRRVLYAGSRFLPQKARELHLESRAWLAEEIRRIRSREGKGATIVVVTHHAPIPEANPPQYRGGELSPAFVSDMTDFIRTWQPSVWIWGHTHHSMDAMIGSTRLISAQRGYVGMGEGAETFFPAVIDV
jgi:hypothetical protein